MIQFPKWKYHKTLDAVMVLSAEEEKALGPEWANSPAAFKGTSEGGGSTDNTPAGATSDSPNGSESIGLEDLPEMTEEQKSAPDSEPVSEEPSAEPAHEKTYREHQAEWESKEDKARAAMSVKELTELLIKKGAKAKDLKGLKKAELIEKLKG